MLNEDHPTDLEKGGLFMSIKDIVGTLGERALHLVAVLAVAGVALESMAGFDFEDGVNHPLDTVEE